MPLRVCYSYDMIKAKTLPASKKLLTISLILNAIFIVFIIAGLIFIALPKQNIDLALFNTIQQKICGEDYQKYLQQVGEAHGEEGKNAFAITTCLRNYKTGQDLNLKPLEDQVK